MASSSKGQRAAKKRRERKRELTRNLGLPRPIIARHNRGTRKREEKEQKQPAVVCQLILTRGPRNAYEIDDWVRNICVWCSKTYSEADSIIIKAMAYEEDVAANPPVLFSCASMSDVKTHRLRFDGSILGAIEIVEKVAG